MKIIDVEDFLEMSYYEKLYLFSMGYILQTPMYDTIPRQLPTKMGYLYTKNNASQGDKFVILATITGLSLKNQYYDFYINLTRCDGISETIHSYMGDYGEISCSFLHTVTEPEGKYIMEGWVVDSEGNQALIDSCEYNVNGDKFNKNDNKIFMGLLGLGFLGLMII